MRKTRVPQASIFEIYSEHEFGQQLKRLSDRIDELSGVILPLIEKELKSESTRPVGRNGLSVESVFRCLLLKQMLQCSYESLAFYLSDSMSYRTFARLTEGMSPKKSSLQATIRRLSSSTLKEMHEALLLEYFSNGELSLEKVRIDSTVVKSDIAPPSDSQLLNDGVRVLSRLMSKSKELTGIKLRFTDKRKPSKSLAFSIFNAKKAEKQSLYPKLFQQVSLVLKQADSALDRVRLESNLGKAKQKWLAQVAHYRDLLIAVAEQAYRRVVLGEAVPSSEKIVSLFEEHTDIVVKSSRDVQYGHKINLSSDGNGLITYMAIEEGNPSDADRFISVIHGHVDHYGEVPKSVVSDGCYASLENALEARALGIDRVVFHKKRGISYREMGVKEKTFIKLRNFRAGIEGNISELKRTFGLSKARWKGPDGFNAFVWSSVISYNLVRLVRIGSS